MRSLCTADLHVVFNNTNVQSCHENVTMDPLGIVVELQNTSHCCQPYGPTYVIT